MEGVCLKRMLERNLEINKVERFAIPISYENPPLTAGPEEADADAQLYER